MIGSLISMKYIGKESWIRALTFWAVLFVVGIILSSFLSMLGMFLTIISIAIVIFAAHYWYKKTWQLSIVIAAVAFVIDLIIIWILILSLLAWFGVSWSYYFGGLI